MKVRATKKNGLPIRGERSFGARVEIVDTLAFGEEFEVVEEYDGWLYIEGKGWCDASYTEPVTFDAGSGGSGGASSWNDLEDKPFWSETTLTEVVPEMSGEATDMNGMFALFPNSLGSSTLTVGESYLVTFNGEDYTCVAKENNGITYIGSTSIAGMNDGGSDPFCIMPAPPDNLLTAYFKPELVGTVCTISVSKITEEVKTLDPKYMPEPMFLYVV